MHIASTCKWPAPRVMWWLCEVAHGTGYELGQVCIRERKYQEMTTAMVRSQLTCSRSVHLWECTVMTAMMSSAADLRIRALSMRLGHVTCFNSSDSLKRKDVPERTRAKYTGLSVLIVEIASDRNATRLYDLIQSLIRIEIADVKSSASR